MNLDTWEAARLVRVCSGLARQQQFIVEALADIENACKKVCSIPLNTAILQDIDEIAAKIKEQTEQGQEQK